MRRAEHHSRALQTAVVAVVVAALLFGAALETFLPANADTLCVYLNTLDTCIAEGLTLARGDDERRLTRNFYDAEMELLCRDAEKTTSTLAETRPEPELRSNFAEAARLAAVTAGGLRALSIPGAPAESVIAGQATLQDVRTRIQSMEKEVRP